MADPRNQQFSAGGFQGNIPGGFQMMNTFPPQQNQFQMMGAPGMVPGGMVPPGMLPGAMPQMFYAPITPFRGAFVQPGTGFVPAGQGQFAPPPYTPQMAQNFKQKQEKHLQEQKRQQEQQKKRFEAEMKARQFNEQRKRLQEFTTLGGRKVDADSMIKSIMGTTEPKHPQMPQPKPAAAAQAQQQEADDGFGDFMQGPSAQGSVSTSQGSNTSSAGPTALPPGAANAPNPAPVIDEPKQKKADLMAMMIDSCDLNAPQKAKAFTKPQVKDIHRKSKAVTFQQSQKARQWSADSHTEGLDNLFILPAKPPPAAAPPASGAAPQTGTQGNPAPAGSQGAAPAATSAPPAGGPVTLPAWVFNDSLVPKLYLFVLEACTREDKIDTQVLYPILLRSGLPRELLGHIWSLANKKTPGLLVKEELFVVLALIALAQHNISVMTLDALCQCAQPPVPNLGQEEAAPAEPPGGATGSNQQPVAQAVPASIAAPLPAGAPPMVNGSDDFQDFVEAPASAQPQQQPAVNQTVQFPSQPSTSSHAPASFKQTIVSHTPKRKSSLSSQIMSAPQDDDFADFQGVAIPAPVKSASANDLLGEEDKYGVFKSLSDGGSLFNQEDKKDNIKSSETKEETTNDSSAEFADFSSFNSNTDQASSSFADFSKAPAVPSSENWMKQSKSTPSFSTVDDDFSDFQGVTNSTSSDAIKPKSDDKLAAIKSLIQDKSLYKPPDKSKEDTMSVKSVDNTTSQESDQLDLGGSASLKGETSSGLSAVDFEKVGNAIENAMNSAPVKPKQETFGMFDDVKETLPSPVLQSIGTDSSIDWSASSKPQTKAASPEVEDDWADFSSAPPPLATPEYEQPAKYPDSKPKNMEQKPSTIKTSQPGTKGSMFTRNYEAAGVVPTSYMSAYDLMPPDLDDKEEDEDFDKFGTFHSGGMDPDIGVHTGISSLAGGLDDFGDFSAPAKKYENPTKSKEASRSSRETSVETTSVSSSEFSGWKTQQKSPTKEDAQSVTSLELGVSKQSRGSKDGTPSGVDSQSVSSFEMMPSETERKSMTPQDARSIASLELKAPVGDASSQEGPVEESYGEFSSAAEAGTASSSDTPDVLSPVSPMEELPTRPKDASEILKSGAIPSFGDRYSSLTEGPQDGDRHLYDWQRSLEKCKEMVEQANNMFNSVSSSAVCNEVVKSEAGSNYLTGVVEIYRVVCRITTAIRAISLTSAKLDRLLKDIDLAWNNMTAFIATSPVMPDPVTLEFSHAVIKSANDNTGLAPCGLCLLDVDSKVKTPGGLIDSHKLTYGGTQYHASCANFWVNCVDSTLPALKIPELL